MNIKKSIITLIAFCILSTFASASMLKKNDIYFENLYDFSENLILDADGSADIVGGVRIGDSHCYAIPDSDSNYVKVCLDDIDMRSDADTRTRITPARMQVGSTTNYTAIDKVAIDIIDASDDILIHIGDTYNGIKIKDNSGNDYCFFNVNTGTCLNDTSGIQLYMGEDGAEYGYTVSNTVAGSFVQLNLNGIDYFDGSDYMWRLYSNGNMDLEGNLDVDGTLNIEGVPTFQAEIVANLGINIAGNYALPLTDATADGDVLHSHADGSTYWATKPAGVTDHGVLTGLLDDDHPQYLLTNGLRTLTGDLDVGASGITTTTTNGAITITGNGTGNINVYHSGSNATYWHLTNNGLYLRSDDANMLNIFGYSNTAATAPTVNYYRRPGNHLSYNSELNDGDYLQITNYYGQHSGFLDKLGLQKIIVADDVKLGANAYIQSSESWYGSLNGTNLTEQFKWDFADGTFSALKLSISSDATITGNALVDGVVSTDALTSFTGNTDIDIYGAGSGNVNITDSLDVDTINEYSSDVGVTIDSMVVQDGAAGLATQASDPCGTLAVGSIFYSAVGDGVLCYCNNNGDDIRADDSTTACTY